MNKTVQHRGWNSGIGWRVTSATLALTVVLGLEAVTTHSGQAQTYKEKVLYDLTGDGGHPNAG
jgi:hypothetical protein